MTYIPDTPGRRNMLDGMVVVGVETSPEVGLIVRLGGPDGKAGSIRLSPQAAKGVRDRLIRAFPIEEA